MTTLTAPTRVTPARSCMNAEPADPALSRMFELVRDHWRLNRTAVSPDTDLLVQAVCRTLPCTVREFPAGREALTWIIPHRWRVREAWLAREGGDRIVDFSDHPLHLWTHSVPFDGVLSRAELEPHLHHDPSRPDSVPYHFIHGYRYNERPSEWGFCLTHRQYRQLGDGRFRVHIDADLNLDGSMKVIDCHLPGRETDTIFFAAHTCHPGQAADGLSNVAVLVELFERLAHCKERRYTYRLILGPEYFAAAAMLSTMPHEEISVLRGGIYVDMVGNGQPFGFSTSYQGNAPIDRVIANVMRHHAGEHLEFVHRKLAGNDEMFYNGPGFEIPTVEFGCGPSPHHHSDADSFDRLDGRQMLKALALLERMIDAIESDFIPVRKFRGPLYLSRYGLYTPLQQDEPWHDAQERIPMLMDGWRSCFEIADRLGVDYDKVRSFCTALEQHGLIERREGMNPPKHPPL